MADKNPMSFEEIIEFYEKKPTISKIVVIQRKTAKGGENYRINKAYLYVYTDKPEEEILSIISGRTKVVLGDPTKEKYKMDPETRNLLDYYASKSERKIKNTHSKKKQRFTFNKVKIRINELLDKMGELKKEDPKKFAKITSNLKKKIKTAIEKGKVYISLGLAALAFMGIGIGIGANMDKTEKEPTTNPTQYEEGTSLNTEQTTFETQVGDEEITKEQQNEIDTVAEVEEDFIKDYLEAYNKAYGTEYLEAELIVTNLRGTSLYQLPDGRKVTRGNLPYETQKVLNELGGFEVIHMESDVIQIVLSDGTILATYNVTTGEFIYSGNQSRDLKNKKFVEPTLEKLGIKTGRLRVVSRS